MVTESHRTDSVRGSYIQHWYSSRQDRLLNSTIS